MNAISKVQNSNVTDVSNQDLGTTLMMARARMGDVKDLVNSPEAQAFLGAMAKMPGGAALVKEALADVTGGAAAPAAAAQEPAAAAPTQMKIAQGDTLGALAQRYGVSVADFKAANPGVINDVNKIQANAVINLPPNAKVPAGDTRTAAVAGNAAAPKAGVLDEAALTKQYPNLGPQTAKELASLGATQGAEAQQRALAPFAKAPTATAPKAGVLDEAALTKQYPNLGPQTAKDLASLGAAQGPEAQQRALAQFAKAPTATAPKAGVLDEAALTKQYPNLGPQTAKDLASLGAAQGPEAQQRALAQFATGAAKPAASATGTTDVSGYLKAQGVTLDRNTTGVQSAATINNAMKALNDGVESGKLDPHAAQKTLLDMVSPDSGYKFKLAGNDPRNNAYVPVAQQLGRMAQDTRLTETERRQANGAANNLLTQFNPLTESALVLPISDAFQAGQREMKAKAH